MRLLLLSDIHGNLSALNAVFEDAFKRNEVLHIEFDGVVLLGDNIDYGMRSNEVVSALSSLGIPVVCSLWGNHENAVLTLDFGGFSTLRGEQCAKNTALCLDDAARLWLIKKANHAGIEEALIDGKRVLFVHGNISDPLWGKISCGQSDFSMYADFDVVVSGHSHIPHAFTVLLDVDNFDMRNKKAIVFINPGSVGQPRNHDPRAFYAIWDTERGIELNAVKYDIALEQSLYDGSVDDFYRDRLEKGI